MSTIVIAILYIAAFGAIYALLYVLNHRTKVPEGCEDIQSSCKGCGITSCSNHPTHYANEEGSEIK